MKTRPKQRRLRRTISKKPRRCVGRNLLLDQRCFQTTAGDASCQCVLHLSALRGQRFQTVSVFEFALYDLYVPFQAQAAEKAAWTQKAKAEAMARRHAAELDALQAGGVLYLFHILFCFFPRLHPDFNHFDLISVAEWFL